MLNDTNTGPAYQIAAGGLAAMLTIACALAPTAFLSDMAQNTLVTGLLWLILGSSLIASRSLYDHVIAVYTPLHTGNIDAARKAVSMIVGRDTAHMTEAAIARASLESLAENMSDGVVAPLLWGAVFGLPGIAAYKAVNTLDSMIGHRTQRYLYFGRFSARLDDIMNWIPARITGMILCLVSANKRSWHLMWRDAPQHRSVNAGWPEAAMAAALNIRLSGPRSYGTTLSHDPWLNPAASDPTPADLSAGLMIYRRALLCLAAMFAIIIAASRLS